MFRRRPLSCAGHAGALIVAIALNAGEGARAGEETSLASEYVATVQYPVFVTHVPGDGSRIFTVGKHGRIEIVRDGARLDTPFLDLDAVVDSAQWEQGLLGMVFHPDALRNGRFYVAYSEDPSGDVVIARYAVSADPDVADPASAEIVLRIERTSGSFNHYGGWLGFGPNDGYLYIASGNANSLGSAQDRESLLGKILRIDVDCDAFPEDPERNYGIPADNPFVGLSGRDELWAYGLRNPWRCSFDRATSDLYIFDVGEQTREEINFQPASSGGGENYGWACKEGTLCTTFFTCSCFDPNLVDPIFEYDTEGMTAAIVGGYVYRGHTVADLYGALVFADFWGRIWMLRHDGSRVTQVVEIRDQLSPSLDGYAINRVASFGEDAAGELYICEGATSLDDVLRIVWDPKCAGLDLDGSGDIGLSDLLAVMSAWGPCDECPEDVDGDGLVGFGELLLILTAWGPC